MKITVETTIKAPIADIWRMYTTPEDILVWNTASEDWHTTSSEIDLREGGKFNTRMEAKNGLMGFNLEGVYTKVVENEVIECEFGDRTSQVLFEEAGDDVKLTIHFDPDAYYPESYQKAGWQAILDSFKKYVESNS